jgi:hypothetical protein
MHVDDWSACMDKQEVGRRIEYTLCIRIFADREALLESRCLRSTHVNVVLFNTYSYVYVDVFVYALRR